LICAEIWWERYDTHHPILQKYVIRILSQPYSSSMCEKYQLVTTKSDNRTFKLNTLMMEEYKSRGAQSTKPIIFDELVEVSDGGYDWENETNFLSHAPCSLIDDIINHDMLNDPSNYSKLSYLLSKSYLSAMCSFRK
jgi:hypothetical protein